MLRWRLILKEFLKIVRKAILLTAVVFITYIAGVIIVGMKVNPHIVRATFIETIVTDDRRLFNDSVSFFIFESPEVIERFHYYRNDQFSSNRGMEGIFSLLKFVDTAFYNKCTRTSIFVPQRPSKIMDFCKYKHLRGRCYNDAILFNFLSQVNGFKTRNVSLDALDGYGGSGHAVVEVWIPDLEKWVLVDAQNLAIFYDGHGNPMSALEIRKSLIENKDFNIQVEQYGANFILPDSELIGYYAGRIPTLVLIRKNNFESRYDNRILSFVSSLETGCGKPCLLMARFLYSLLAGEERVLYKDERTRYMDFVIWNSIFKIMLTFLFVLGVLGSVFALFMKIKGGRES